MTKWFVRSCALVALALLAGCASSATSAPASAAELASTLRAALPAGITAQVTAEQGGLIRYTDAGGATAMEVALSWAPPGLTDQAASCPLYSQRPFDRCVRNTLRDGALVALDQGYVDPLAPNGAREWSASLVRPSGESVSITEWQRQPLTLDQLASVADSARWTGLVRRLPQPPAPSAPPIAPVVDSSRIFAVLRQQVPRTIRLVCKDSADRGYVEATMDDGQGVALLTITVQRWQNPNDPDLTGLFRGARRQPDGTQVTTRHQALTGGAVQDDADVRTPGGFRVALSQVNAPAFGLPASRGGQVFSVDQLTGLALALSHATR